MKKQTPHKPLPKSVKWLWGIVFAPFALLLLLLLLTAAGLFGRLPSFEELENPKSNLATEILSSDGKVLGTFFVQNRSYVQYDELFPLDSAQLLRLDGYDVPPIIAALVSTEDVRYRGHSGIDLMSLVRVGVKTVLMQNTSQGGGSTITQQLAKNLFPRDINENRGKIARTTKLVVSKLKEWITALKLEYNYTKEEIAAMYLNTVEFGSNAYGIKSAAHTFFNKEPHELNIQEAALLAGLVKGPTMYSPRRNPENALARRNLVLDRMASAGAITRHQRDSIAALPILLNYKPVSHNEGPATYFREMLRLTMNAERPPVPERLGLRTGGQGVRRKSDLRLVPEEYQSRRHALRHLPRRSEDLHHDRLPDAGIRRAGHSKADGVGDPAPDGRTVQTHQNALHRRRQTGA